MGPVHLVNETDVPGATVSLMPYRIGRAATTDRDYVFASPAL